MEPRRSFDRELLIPIGVAIVSILGLAWILWTNPPSVTPTPPPVEPTAIPFDPAPLETRLATLRPPATSKPEETPPTSTATETSPPAYPGPPAETLPAESQPGTAVTQGAPGVEPLPPGKYDNTHPNIAYDRYWAFKRNAGTTYAYQGTLHVSTGIGNELSFQFTGQRITLGYQRGRNFGTVTVWIDGQPYSFHQQAFGNIWTSPSLTPGTHSVRLIHESGETINLDYIEVVG